MDKIVLLIDGDEYWLEGGEFDDLLEAIKSLPGRRYDPAARAWIVPFDDPRDVAARVRPYKLMYVDDDPLGDSTPSQVSP
jgi:hypothetical protein